MEKQYLTATDLMNYSYCPRIIYFVHVLRKPQFTTKKEYKGREKEVDFQAKARRTKIVKSYPKLPKILKVHLVFEKLGWKTIVDSILINKEKGEAYPIQAKYSFTPRKIYKAQKRQIVMEAMLIEEIFGHKVPYGYIKFLRSGDLIKVFISEADKADLIETFSKIGKIIYQEHNPKPTKFVKRCTDCCFKNICMRS